MSLTKFSMMYLYIRSSYLQTCLHEVISMSPYISLLISIHVFHISKKIKDHSLGHCNLLSLKGLRIFFLDFMTNVNQVAIRNSHTKVTF